MTLTVVVGSSGSGKTTFLNQVYKSHKCVYIRQYHMMRPYISVSKIPNFDPTKLPFWNIYENEEGKARSIKVGGTMAGEFTAGLSGGQRKLLLFELICQRTKNQSKDLLIALDEPFCGVTDDFVPYVVERLNEMRQKHNIVLVTNDHVEKLTSMADNTITVSAIDRTLVHVNENKHAYDRQQVILALSVGGNYAYTSSCDDLKFFFNVEVLCNTALLTIAAFCTFCFSLLVATFWGSDENSAALVLVAGGMISYICVNPYLNALVDWRNVMTEEAQALMHASKRMNKILKTSLTIVVITLISLLEYVVVNLVMDGDALADIKFWVGILFDSVSMTIMHVWLGLFTKLSFQAVQILGALPFLLMIFTSTTFSPGAGIPALKELRYINSRFYLWCMLPGTQDYMEGCPSNEADNMLYLILSSLTSSVIFLCIMVAHALQRHFWVKRRIQMTSTRIRDDEGFLKLQTVLYDDK